MSESFYTKALGGFRAYLAQDHSQQSETIALRTIFILIIYERSRIYPSKDVYTHLTGVAVLIKSCCDQLDREPPESTPDTSNLARILALEAFIFHAATSLPFQSPACRSEIVDDAFNRAVDSLQQLLRRGTIDPYKSPILGAPPRLFAYVRQVALLYQRFRIDDVLEVQQCLDLDDNLSDWDNESFTAETSGQHSTSAAYSIDKTNENQTLCLSSRSPRSNAPLPGLQLYVLATRILLNHMVNPGTAKEGSMAASISETMSLVLLIDPMVDYFADYYVWPFFCLGVSESMSHYRNLIMGKIVTFWETTRNGPMRLLGDMLSYEWKQPKRQW
ncbi:hypothetical protein LTR10_018643 [Elasticomyces elasticus]|uniref:Uncharacterized protein n=1 Tax=Exophiala sideris TaxID=1016849 RepID=A0ABR0JS38_9EURO|nr:hypothetical protein LTR10_018643 [Elasticomyces elasticus]KAK5040388.1 hypothetical protein LTS07_000886 [Exophiala sideris]KAK5043185.1 hypothetical protein LTR13_000956 [Exophiala sideris]KAK5068766.1 hypothetical protein LTR69_000887 [Exophiala sideris]KAK5186364.1 hypothetical protein LTR44_001420 [Eurotiomycetes sp. CCFEE 6388]